VLSRCPPSGVRVLSPRLQRGARAEPEATEGVGVPGQRLRRVGRAEPGD
jgi:hypothetical protein